MATGRHPAMRMAQRARGKWQTWVGEQSQAVRDSLHDLDWDNALRRPNKRGFWYACRRCGGEYSPCTFSRFTCQAVPAESRLSYLELAVRTGNSYAEARSLKYKAVVKTEAQVVRKIASNQAYYAARAQSFRGRGLTAKGAIRAAAAAAV